MADLGLGQVYLAQGDYEQAVAILTKIALSAAINYFYLSEAYAARGDKEKALATLQKAFESGFQDFAVLDASPYFSSLRADPRFRQMIERNRKLGAERCRQCDSMMSLPMERKILLARFSQPVSQSITVITNFTADRKK
jgi:tetratricopeptide (TPR) repeat protein